MADSQDTMRWVWRGIALFVLLFGWGFIAWQNHFHISAPVVFTCLGYLAVVATVANLWRTGAAAVADDELGDSTWAKPTGALSELEREKRTLLKAIKEAEFDHQMGKLSKADVDHMVATYRARAIEVYKEIERLETGHAGTAREQIMREVRARIDFDAKAKPKAADKVEKAGKKADKAKPLASDAVVATSDAAAEAADASAAAANAAADDAAAEADAAEAEAAAVEAKVTADDLLDADSTTALEPKRDEPAKEAMR